MEKPKVKMKEIRDKKSRYTESGESESFSFTYMQKGLKERGKVFSHLIKEQRGKNTVVKLQQGILCYTVQYWKGITTMQHLGQ